MTNAELEVLKRHDKFEMKSATYKTVEKIANYMATVRGENMNDADLMVLLDYVAQVVLYAYKTGSETTETILKETVEEAEVVDVEFVLVEEK